MYRHWYNPYCVQKSVYVAGRCADQGKSRENSERFCLLTRKGNVNDISFSCCLKQQSYVGWTPYAFLAVVRQCEFLLPPTATVGAVPLRGAVRTAGASGLAGAAGGRQVGRVLGFEPRGGQAQQDGPGLGHVERIERPRQRYAQHVRAPFDNARAQAFFFIAQYQNGG